MSVQVVFFDIDGKDLAKRTIKEGDAIGSLPEAPEVEGRTFVGWFDDKDTRVTEDTIVLGIMHISPKYEASAEEVEMPEQTFRDSVNGITVEASVEPGVFPEGTEMHLSAISDESALAMAKDAVGESAVDAVAVGISFTDAEGGAIAPASGTVHFHLSSRTLEGDAFAIYRKSGDGYSRLTSASASGGSFDTASYSRIILVGKLNSEPVDFNVEGEPEAYSYYLAGTINGWATNNASYKLYDNPATPGEYMISPVYFTAGDEFKITDGSNWYPAGNYYINETGKYSVYFTPSTQHVYADKVSSAWTVTFMNGDTTVETRLVADGEAVGTLPADPEGPEGSVFDKWMSGEEEFTAETVVSADMTVTATYVETRTVTFMSGETVVETRTVGNGKPIGELPAAPEVEGYRFDKWVIQNTETEVTADTLVEGDMTVTAEYVRQWTVTFYNRDAEVHETVKVDEGEEIGDQLPAVIAREDYNAYWAIGEIVSGGQGNEIRVTGARINSSFIPTENTTIVPDYEKISYTITFYTDDTKSTVHDTKTVTADTSYCLNDIPAVPAVQGSLGKWVYAGGDFTNRTSAKENAVDGNLDVWPVYEKNVFTVVFMVEGSSYKTEQYNKNDELVLPADPVVEGKEFVQWTYNGQPISAGTPVTSDMEIIAEFEDEYYVRFVILNDDGTVREQLSQYFRTEGEAIGTMPQDPFIEGKIFEKWIDQDTGEDVTADTVVNDNITAVAQFRTVDVYNITVEYYYIGSSGEVIFSTELLQVEHSELPYTITAPSTTKTDPNEVSGAPVYYPETPTVEVKESDFDTDKHCLVRVKYVPYTAVYDFVYMLKDLTGNGYTEIDRESNVEGVLNSYVTPTVKTFTYAAHERAEGAVITTSGIDGQPKQELKVYSTRKNFQLTYESNGGSYVGGTTAPYGSTVQLSSTVPTKTGYTFDGWYLDEDLTQAAGSSVVLNGNTTVYAKWTGNNVDVTVVYMFEKYNDAGTASSFVYDNSETYTAQVGVTVYGNDGGIEDKTRTGWEKDDERNAASSVVVAADGSSVLYVYYTLVE